MIIFYGPSRINGCFLSPRGMVYPNEEMRFRRRDYFLVSQLVKPKSKKYCDEATNGGRIYGWYFIFSGNISGKLDIIPEV